MAVISVTPANVTVSAPLANKVGVAGATITAGQSLYSDSTDSNKLKLADADVQATAVCVGVSLNGAASGQPVSYVSAGSLTVGGGVVAGTIYVVSTTPGGIGTATDPAQGDFISIIGIGTATNAILVNLNISGVAEA